MKLKGHAKIELTDVHTGEKQVVEHDNMITNAVNDLCNPIGLLSPGIAIQDLNLSKPLVESLFGGLMLWEEPLNDDPDDYLFPAGVNCVGYACDKANTGVNTMMGTYNDVESGYQDDGSHKKVWDFSTAQANGTIASLSLVPTLTGNIGWGATEYDSSLVRSSGGYVDEKINIDSKEEGYLRDKDLFVKDGYLYAIKQGNIIYNSTYQARHISRNGGKLIIQKLLYPTNKLSLFSQYKYIKLAEEFEVQLPQEFVDTLSSSATAYYGMCTYDDVSNSINLLLTSSEKIYAGGTVKLCRISITDFTCTCYEVTIPENVVLYNALNDDYSYSQISGNKLLLKIYNSYNIVVIDINTNVSNEITLPVTSSMVFGSARGNFVYIGNGYVPNWYAIDVTNNDLKTLNTYHSSKYNYDFHTFYRGAKFIGSKIYSVYNLNCLSAYYHIMLTKNNLSSPVTKTASQTMKITYTISKET